MKTKEDFINYTEEDFSNLLARLVSKENLDVTYCCLDIYDDLFRIYYDGIDNTLYQITEKIIEREVEDVIYKNEKITLSVYPLSYIERMVKFYQTDDYTDPDRPDEVRVYDNLVNDVYCKELERLNPPKVDLPF